MKKLLLLLLLLSNCARPIQHMDSELQPYVDSFDELYGHKVNYVEGVFYYEDSQIMGMCYMNDHPLIKINMFYWQDLEEVEKVQLMYHELGHCVLNRGHLDKLYPDGCGISIMSTYELSSYCMVLHYEDYIKELFNEGYMNKENT